MLTKVKSWQVIITIVLTMVGLFVLDEPTRTSLFFDKTSVWKGELWRLVTAHFVHLTTYHLIANTIGLLLIWQVFREHFNAATLTLVIASLAVLISLQLSTPWTNTSYFFGFSGVLHGLLAYSLLTTIRQNKPYCVVLVGLFAKVSYEQTTYFDPTTQLSLIDAPVAVDVHLAGVIAAVLLQVIAKSFKRMR